MVNRVNDFYFAEQTPPSENSDSGYLVFDTATAVTFETPSLLNGEGLSEISRRIAEIEAEIKALEQEIQNNLDRRAELERRQQILLGEIENFQTTRDSLDQQILSLEAEMARIEGLPDEALTTRKAELEREVAHLSSEINSRRAQLERIGGEIREINQTIETLKNTILGLRETQLELHQLWMETLKRINNYQNSLEIYQRKKEELEKLAAKRKEKEFLENRLQDQSLSSSERRRLEARIHQLDEEIRRAELAIIPTR